MAQCAVCGKICKSEYHLKIHMISHSPDSEGKQQVLYSSNFPAAFPSMPAPTGEARLRVAELAGQLQEAQLKDQLAKLQTPGSDMFRTMMEMQQKTFDMVNAMAEQNAEDRIAAVKIQSDLQLQIAKLEMGKPDGESDTDNITKFITAIPDIMGMLKSQNTQQGQEQSFELGSNGKYEKLQEIATPKKEEIATPKKEEIATNSDAVNPPGSDNNMENFDFASFKKLIIDGQLSYAEAKEIWDESLPYAPKAIQVIARRMTEADFKKKYDMIKAGQL
jgi:hypothetical protein